jgi:arylsulfatase A-like enzyme
MNWANGFHRMNGVFLAYGPGVQAGSRVEDATMVDVAPTILYDLGLPVPTNMDGQVLGSVLAVDLAADPVRYEAPLTGTDSGGDVGYTDSEQADVSGRLAALGYIE